jgi:hypothetical protein
MSGAELPFDNGQEVEVEVLVFEPWEKNKSRHFVFDFEGDLFAMVSPYNFRSKKLKRGDKIRISFERFKNNYGYDAGRFHFIDKL